MQKLVHEELDNVLSLYEESYHSKILYYLKKELPERLEQYKTRLKRLENMQNETEQFINEFTIDSEIKYMYIQKTNLYVKYDGGNYIPINESILLHKVLSKLSNKRELMQWKYKIKNTIIKNIRETTVFDMIPESKTIQTVLNGFTNMLFTTKVEARYFLTLLGDNILKKNQELIHLTNPSIKPFINVMEDYLFNYFQGKYHINTTFKYSWHDHPYINCRCLNFKYQILDLQKWKNFIKQNILNIVAAAVHYSNRHINSDTLLKRLRTDKEIVNNILYTVEQTDKTLVKTFIKEMIQTTNCSTSITFKEILYLWKIFIKNNKIPNLLFSSALKDNLQNQYEYNVSNNEFVGIESSILKKTNVLREFWNNFIITDSTEIMEISDLCEIYNEWLESEDNEGLNECALVSIITHFYDITVSNNIISGIKCSLWDKKGDLVNVLNEIKTYYKFSPENDNITIETIYNNYSKLCDNKFNYRIVRKECFKKYIIQLIPNKYIIKKRISKDYWLT